MDLATGTNTTLPNAGADTGLRKIRLSSYVGADCAPTTPVEITRAAAQASNVDFFILYSSFLSLDYGESIFHTYFTFISESTAFTNYMGRHALHKVAHTSHHIVSLCTHK